MQTYRSHKQRTSRPLQRYQKKLKISKLPLTTGLKFFPKIAKTPYFQHVDDNSLWFRAVPTCKILGFRSVTSALKNLSKNTEVIKEVHDGRQNWFISESGVYALAVRARTKEAKEFKNWVTRVLIPKQKTNG